MKLHSQLEISVLDLLKLYTPHWLKWDEESFPLWLFMKCEPTTDCDAWVRGAGCLLFPRLLGKTSYLPWSWGRGALQIHAWTRCYLFGWSGNLLGRTYFIQESFWGAKSETSPAMSTGAGMWAFGTRNSLGTWEPPPTPTSISPQ